VLSLTNCAEHIDGHWRELTRCLPNSAFEVLAGAICGVKEERLPKEKNSFSLGLYC